MGSQNQNPFQNEDPIFERVSAQLETRETDNNIAPGLTITGYEIFQYKRTDPLLKGEVLFEGTGIENREASFFHFPDHQKDSAVRIFDEASKLHEDGILVPRFLKHIKNKKLWILCYEKIDGFLSEDHVANFYPVGSDSQIRKLLMSIKYLHSQNLIHGALDQISSYVVTAKGKIKILITPTVQNFEETLPSTRLVKDLTDFKDMLKTLMKDDARTLDFFSYFDHDIPPYRYLIEKLIEHPSLKNSYGKTKVFLEMEQAIVSLNLYAARPFMEMLETNEEVIARYGNWDKKIDQDSTPILFAVNDYESITYDGVRGRDLIRFLANAHAHNYSNDFDLLYNEIASAFPGFLSFVYKHLKLVEKKKKKKQQ